MSVRKLPDDRFEVNLTLEPEMSRSFVVDEEQSAFNLDRLNEIYPDICNGISVSPDEVKAALDVLEEYGIGSGFLRRALKSAMSQIEA